MIKKKPSKIKLKKKPSKDRKNIPNLNKYSFSLLKCDCVSTIDATVAMLQYHERDDSTRSWSSAKALTGKGEKKRMEIWLSSNLVHIEIHLQIYSRKKKKKLVETKGTMECDNNKRIAPQKTHKNNHNQKNVFCSIRQYFCLRLAKGRTTERCEGLCFWTNNGVCRCLAYQLASYIGDGRVNIRLQNLHSLLEVN